MKKSLSILIVIALFTCPSLKGQTDKAKEEAAIKTLIEKEINASPCLLLNEQTDNEKEEEAIKAVFEAEKAAYFKQDYVTMGEFWIKEPTTMKYWLGLKGSTKIVGWENINESQKEEIEDNSWDRKQMTATFSNYQFNIMGNSAWIFCETNWEGKVKGEGFNLKQERIVVMKKVDDKWKFSLYGIFQMPNPTPTNK